MRFGRGFSLILTAAALLLAPAWGQPQPSERGRLPHPVEPRSVQSEISPEVEVYRSLQRLSLSEDRLSACKSFAARFPGTQLALRVMREAAELYLLKEENRGYNPLEECSVWMESHLASPAFAWSRYRNAPSSVFVDRVETHLVYARVVASSAYYERTGRENPPAAYERALRELSAILTEIEARPDVARSRPDLLEQIHFARCWCLHGKRDVGAALRSYEWFIESFPNSDFMPAALRNAALCMNPTTQAQRIETYNQRLLEEYPGSAEAVGLRRQLQNRN